MKNLSLILLLILSFSSSVQAGGDDLVKTWKSKQKAYYLGESLVEQNTVEAIEKMDKLLKKYKWSSSEKVGMLHKLADLHLNLGRILENKGSKKRANNHILTSLKIYKGIINRYPKYSKIEHVLFSRGFELFMKKSFSTAEKTLAQLNKRFPKSKFKEDSTVIRADSLFELKKYKTAISLYAKTENSSDIELSLYSRYRKSWSLFNQRKFDQAYLSLYALAKKDKTNKDHGLYSSGEALTDLPRFFQKQSKSTRAYADFSALKGHKGTEAMLYELSDMYFDAGEWNKASGIYNDLIANYSNSKRKSVYHLKNGIALSTKSKITKSSEEIKKGLKSCKSKLCASIAQDDIFKIVNDWEKHWRQKQSDNNYSKALATVYPSLADNTQKKSEKSKIYLLLAEVEYHLKRFKKSSVAFERAFLENPKASYARQAKWNSIDTLMKIKSEKWSSKDISRLSRLVNAYISEFPNDKKSINAQSFLAKVYMNSNQPKMAANLYRKVSEEHIYTNVGLEAYNNFLKINIKENKYKTVADYLLSLKELDVKKLKLKLINGDLDQTYNEWTEHLAKKKSFSRLVYVYDQALKNRDNSKLIKSWVWNRSLALVTIKSYKKSAQSFLTYVEKFDNKEGKRIEALNNALVSYKKARMRKEALSVISRLLEVDSSHRQDWLTETVYLHIELKDYMEAFEVLSQIDRNHPQKNIIFESLIKKLNEKELFKVRRSNLSSFSSDSVAELLLRLVTKVNDLDSQQTKSLALELSKLKTSDSNYNAKGFYILGVHDYRKLKKSGLNISSNLQRSLDKIIKKIMKIDELYRNSVSKAFGKTQTDSLIALGEMYLFVATEYTNFAKKRFKAQKSVTDVEEFVAPFLEQTKFFASEAKSSLKSVDSKRSAAKLKSKIKRLNSRSIAISRWFKKTNQIKLAKKGL